MTTPRDDIAGLIEKLTPPTGAYGLLPVSSFTLCQAATQLDSLLKERDGYERLYNNEVVERLRAEQERDALQARVKELERERDLYAECSMKEEDCRKIWQSRALRAEQERDEAYERAAKVADQLEDHWSREWRDGLKADTHLEGMSDGASAIAAAIRQLAPGPEKEKKE